MTERQLLATAGRHARAIAELDGRPPSATTAVELYRLMLELEGEDRTRRIAVIDQMLGLTSTHSVAN